MPTASLQRLCPHAAVIRVHDDGAGFGDEFTWACTVQIKGDECWLLGAVGRPTKSAARAVLDALYAGGIRLVHWERRSILAREVTVRLSPRPGGGAKPENVHHDDT